MLALYLAAVLVQMGKPLVYDDVNFAQGALAIRETGFPYGNQGWMSDLGDFSRRDQWALWHPPLYLYLVGLSTWLFGATPLGLRLPGLVGAVAVGVLTYLLAWEVAAGPASFKRRAALVAAALTLSSPLVVQSALVIDIDFALLLPLSLLFLLLVFHIGATQRWPWLAALFALLLWSKMTNPLPLLASVAGWNFLRADWRGVGRTLVAGLGGTAAFLATWLILSGALRMPFGMPFAVNSIQWADSSEVARRAYASPGAFAEGLLPSILWLGPWLVVLGLVAACARAVDLVPAWRVRRTELLLGLLVALVLGYVNKGALWFPKYQVALAPLLAIVAAPLVALAFERAWSWRPTVVAGAGVLASTAVVWLLVRDGWALERTYVLRPEEGIAFALLGTAVAVGLALLRTPSPIPLALAALALGWGLSTSTVMARAPYSTWYGYGTRGIPEAAAWIDANVPPDATYVASKDAAFLARPRRYIDQDTLTYYLETNRPFDGTWEGQQVVAVVAWTREPYIADLLERRLPELGFQRETQLGDYVAYRRRG